MSCPRIVDQRFQMLVMQQNLMRRKERETVEALATLCISSGQIVALAIERNRAWKVSKKFGAIHSPSCSVTHAHHLSRDWQGCGGLYF